MPPEIWVALHSAGFQFVVQDLFLVNTDTVQMAARDVAGVQPFGKTHHKTHYLTLGLSTLPAG